MGVGLGHPGVDAIGARRCVRRDTLGAIANATARLTNANVARFRTPGETTAGCYDAAARNA
eukprot:6615725-Lingulodinium_polyedra.AAC.1